ncbi:MAG: hypothetical protein JO092_09035 [Candidatus Eremiobacteraeota bacterium]|nr:hypothetical protein [Candidatus Eremiobacteraeota bacterium]
MRYVFVALAASALASCAGPWPSSPTPTAAAPPGAQFPDNAQAHLYVAWDNNNLTSSEIRVYQTRLVAQPKLLHTLNTPYAEIRGMTTDASGNLYAAACNSCDDNATSGSTPARGSSASNGIAVYRHGGDPSLDYIAPDGELPIRVAVGSDGTVYSGNAFYRMKAKTWRLAVEIYAKGQKEPTKTLPVVAAAANRNMGLALDGQGNLWASYVQSNSKFPVELVEYASGSSTPKTYALSSQYSSSLGGLTFDSAGRLLVATCFGGHCGTAIFDVPSMQQVAFIRAKCLKVGSNTLCFTPAAFAFNADESQLWATELTGVVGYTYPKGKLKTDFLISRGNEGYLPYGVTVGR